MYLHFYFSQSLESSIQNLLKNYVLWNNKVQEPISFHTKMKSKKIAKKNVCSCIESTKLDCCTKEDLYS